MRRRKQKRHWAVAAALALLVGAGVSVFTGCSDEPAEAESCDEHDDCPEGEVCHAEDEICVEAADADCETDEQCPDDAVCDDGACIQAGDIECELSSDCPDDYICEGDDCVRDEVEDEDYRMSFTSEGDTESEFFVAGGDGDYYKEVDPGAIDCHEARACSVTSDGSHLLAIRSTDDEYEAVTASLQGDPPAVDGQVEVFAESMNRPRVRGDGVAFEREVDGLVVAYYQAFDGDEQQVATLHDTTSSAEHSWEVHPESGRVMQFDPFGLDSLDVLVGTFEEEPSEVVATLDGSAAGEGIGSFQQSADGATASKDGRLVAYTLVGLNEYGDCETHDECSGTSRACGELGRCFALETTVYVIDMEEADNLGEECLGHDECGDVHRCDSGSEDFDGGQCAPQRIVTGLPKSPTQPRMGDAESRSGCEATRLDETFRFTDVNTPMSFGPDDRIYFVGERDCGGTAPEEANIPRTSIVAADPFSGDYEEVFGNLDGRDYTSVGCSSHGEIAEDLDECNLVFESLRFSPEQNEFVLMANNPGAPNSLAPDRMDVWNLQRGTDDLRWIGGQSASNTVVDLDVHAGGEAETD